ncbi:MAG: transketolase [Clostridia bacterium]
MDIDNKSINVARMLAIDSITKAGSGHPGIALGTAPILYSLYKDIMNYNAYVPEYVNRDRFVLSAGHGSALLYAILHLFNFNVTVDDLKKFRQLNSVTAGHPEYKAINGIDTSTGPLGQGVANAVGMALAESILEAEFNKSDCKIFDNYTYVLAGDGCLMEGISYEACSFAGAMKLNKLILIYDSNNTTIDGHTDITFTENIKQRFLSQGFNLITVNNGDDYTLITAAIKKAKSQNKKPSIIIVKTVIGAYSPLANSNKAHGSPLSYADADITRKNLGLENIEKFTVPEDVKLNCATAILKGATVTENYNKMLEQYAVKYPKDYKKLQAFIKGEKIEYVDLPHEEKVATRDLGSAVLKTISESEVIIIGGSADLETSTKTKLNSTYYSALNKTGKNIRFGIREHAMAGICNGLALSGLKTFCSTFLVFSDYMKPSIRLAALMSLPIVYIFTHDSIGVGEDGPTHQPIEQLSALRLIPNLNVYRPCNMTETISAYVQAFNDNKPSAIILSRQKFSAPDSKFADADKGAYIISGESKNSALTIIATGSEIELAIKLQKELANKNTNVCVVSMPCKEIFIKQSKKYQQSILGENPRLIIEAGSIMSMQEFIREQDDSISLDTFGKTGKAEDLFDFFGFSIQNAIKKAKNLIKK